MCHSAPQVSSLRSVPLSGLFCVGAAWPGSPHPSEVLYVPTVPPVPRATLPRCSAQRHGVYAVASQHLRVVPLVSVARS